MCFAVPILGEGATNHRSKYDPLVLLSPLMRNWTEDMAVRRDKYDYEYGRGVGMVILVIMFFTFMK